MYKPRSLGDLMGDQLKYGETMLDIMVIISCKIWKLRSHQPFFWLVVTATKKENCGYRDIF